MNDAGNHEMKWRDMFEKQRAILEEAAFMVLYRQEDPREILCSAINQLKDRPFHEVFGPVCALREVVKAAIARNEDSSEHDIEQRSDIALHRWHSGPLPLEALPWPERAVYFLREVQHYTRRDTALLLGISDGEVDELKKSAKKRMGYPEEPTEREFRRPAPPAASFRVRHSIAFAAFE
jgi:DNA-directed RNA polymerase specialized sigma24 family protein